MGTGLSGVIRFIDIPSIMIILVFLCISLGIGGQLKYYLKDLVSYIEERNYIIRSCYIKWNML